MCDCRAAAPSVALALAVPRAGRTWGTGSRAHRSLWSVPSTCAHSPARPKESFARFKVQQHPSLSSWAPPSQGPLGCPCLGDSFAVGVIWHWSQLPSPAVTERSGTGRAIQIEVAESCVAAITVSLGNQQISKSQPLPSWKQVGLEEEEEKCTDPSLGLHVPPPIIPQAQWCREDPFVFCPSPYPSQHLSPFPSLSPCLWFPLTPQPGEG